MTWSTLRLCHGFRLPALRTRALRAAASQYRELLSGSFSMKVVILSCRFLLRCITH